MAPQPKPPGQRRRANAGQAQWVQLSAQRDAETPELPGRGSGWLPDTEKWWDTIWASPMASVWLDADVDGLVRLATLKDDFARGDAPAVALPAMQQLEDRFGLSPKARRALQWEVSREQVASDGRPSLAVVKPLKLDKAPGA